MMKQIWREEIKQSMLIIRLNSLQTIQTSPAKIQLREQEFIVIFPLMFLGPGHPTPK